METVHYQPVQPEAAPSVTSSEPISQPVAEPVHAPVAEPAPVYVAAPPAAPEAPWRPPEVRLGRHASSDGQPVQATDLPAEAAPEPRGRHWVPADTESAPPGRHRPMDEAPEDVAAPTADEEPEGQHAGGQSFADLMARFQVPPPAGGGGRRRRDD